MKLNRSIILIIMVAAFAIGYLYYSQSSQLIQVISEQPASTKDDLNSFKDISLSFSVLDDSRFKSLRVFGELPVKPGVTGKRDLFSPF